MISEKVTPAFDFGNIIDLTTLNRIKFPPASNKVIQIRRLIYSYIFYRLSKVS